MNNVVNYYQRQYGNYFSTSYDSLISRLVVHEKDSWRGISPSIYTSDFNPTPPILAAKFAKTENHKNILAIANEDGKVAIQNTNIRNDDPGGECALDGEQCHFNAVFDVEWMPGSMKLVSASGDHTARLWSLTESKLISTQVFNGHSRSVKTAAFRQTDPAVFATGGRDGAIIIWDIRAQLGSDLAPRADNCIFSGHAGGPGTPSSYKKRTRQTPKIPPHVCSSSITGLAFQDDSTLISCGAGDGLIKVWDVRRHYSCHNRDPLPKHSFPYGGTTTLKGFTNLLVDNVRMRLYVNCMDNHIYSYNISTYAPEPIQIYSGLKNGTFYIKSYLSPDGKYLISGSTDEKSYIWNVDNPKPLAQLSGHTVEVTSVAWMQTYDDICIVTCSDDARHKIWRMGPEHIPDDEKVNYRGKAEYCEDYRRKELLNGKMKALENTPRSVRRLMERNEKTPNSVEKKNLTFGTKRSFTEISKDDALDVNRICPEIKRPNIETRGRRLFSPQNSNHRSTGFNHLGLTALEVASTSSTSRFLNIILEENEERNQTKSPLSMSDMNLKSPDAASSTTRPIFISSPTINLPNFVLDGEAPHLANVSIKRKLKENVDWLTKIRKQKLLNSSKNTEEAPSDDVSILLSPRLEMLKTSENSPSHHHLMMTPKRRNSRCETPSQPKTPNSSRRNSTTATTPETSILRFFSVATPTTKASSCN